MDGLGSFLHGGRWNSPGQRVVYAATTYGGALLEQLAHAGTGTLPRTQVWTEIDVPDDLPIERVEVGAIPEWNADYMIGSRARGDLWLRTRQSIALIVPSAVTVGLESQHSDQPRSSGLSPDHLFGTEARSMGPAFTADLDFRTVELSQNHGCTTALR